MTNKKFSAKKIDWLPNDLKDRKEWTRDLSSNEKEFIDEMNQNNHFTNTFIKQKLHFLFNDIMEATINLFGFIIIKGFPKPDSTHPISTLRNFFLLFSKMLGIPLIQNNKNEYIYDVKHIHSEKNKSNVRGPQINDALPLHPDHGGLLGMYCLQSAKNGGYTLLGNVKKIHDEINTLRPDLLQILYGPFYGDRRGQQPEGALPYDINPIFTSIDDELLCQYVGFYYHDAQKKFPEIPKFTDEQINALNLFHEVSNNKKFILEVKLNAGDVIFLNNNRVLHGRTKFDESLSNTASRHLLRVWLSIPQIRSFPHYYGYPMPFFK